MEYVLSAQPGDDTRQITLAFRPPLLLWFLDLGGDATIAYILRSRVD